MESTTIWSLAEFFFDNNIYIKFAPVYLSDTKLNMAVRNFDWSHA